MEPITRVCKKCGEEKLLEEFYKSKSCKYDRGHICKVCDNARYSRHTLRNKRSQKEYYLKNKEYIRKLQREYRINNIEVIRERAKISRTKYYLKNKEAVNKRHGEFKKNNKEASNKAARKRSEKLYDSYCCTQLIKRTKRIGCKLVPKDIPQELIKLERVRLQIHRLTKTN